MRIRVSFAHDVFVNVGEAGDLCPQCMGNRLNHRLAELNAQKAMRGVQTKQGIADLLLGKPQQ